MDFVRLKRAITILMIVSHLLTFFWLLFLYFLGGFAFDDLTTSIALLTPLFAGFTTIIVKDAIAEAAPDAAATESRQLPWNFGFLVLAFCGSFAAYLLLIVTLKGFNVGFSTFDQFKLFLGVGETVFGVYVGYLMPTLFTQGGPQVAAKSSVGSTASNSAKPSQASTD